MHHVNIIENELLRKKACYLVNKHLLNKIEKNLST